MVKKILIGLTFITCLCTMLYISYQDLKQHPKEFVQENHQEISMPILELANDVYPKTATPIAQRDSKYIKWLSSNVMIEISNGNKSATGSGTIVYFDPDDGYAYVQSCGHFWRGNMSAKEGGKKKLTCNIVVWYHNEVKLKKPMKYQGEVLYYNNNPESGKGGGGKDCSLLRFKPDWSPDYFSIAPKNFEFQMNSRYHSLGCDNSTEVAHYDVKYIGVEYRSYINGNEQNPDKNYPDVVVSENAPRPGRSGGGLLNENHLVGICVATSDSTGQGIGLFTPVKTIREFNEKNGYGWLNEVGFNLARQIPVIDRNNPQGKYKPDYIPIPSKQ